MSSDKRLVLFVILTFGSVLGLNVLLERTGMLPPPAPVVDKAAAKVAPAKGEPEKDKDKGKANAIAGEKPVEPDKTDPTKVVVGPASVVDKDAPKRFEGNLTLGSSKDEANPDYKLKVTLDQRGAVVARATSTQFAAELDQNDRAKKPGKLDLILSNEKSNAPGSLAIILSSTVKPLGAEVEGKTVEAELDAKLWEVVVEKEGAPAVTSITRTDPVTGSKADGQQVSFRIKANEPAVIVTKTFRLFQGEDGFEVELKFEAPTKDAKFSYQLFGPHGIPIEGEWYTSTFRDVFFGQVNSKPITRTAYDVVKYRDDPSQRISALPLKFAGVEDQYFATLVMPWPTPKGQEDRWDQDAGSVVIKENVESSQKSDVGVEITSKPIHLGQNLGPTVHTYRVFAGPKTAKALTPFGAEDLASYRKNQWISIPFASDLARNVIAPLLDKIYALTKVVAQMFGYKNGNYGIAIILLTMSVRLIMFPLGRKQAMMAKKMQDLQPVLAEVKEKYKDDKEALTRETMAVWKRNKVNPVAGCLPALIQMPIFVGLWQTLNNSVALRQSTFLYIHDLAAPDMLFHFPFEVPLLGTYLGNYFNLLPILVVSLMLIQTKLFAPPATTPEAEMNQKMMKYMMVVMAVMFYKVPSGLGLYFITSSSWQICERLLLPKVIAKKAKATDDDDPFGGKGGGGGKGGSGGNGNGGGGGQGRFGRWMERLLEEAAKEKTIRNNNDRPADRTAEPQRGIDRDRDRPRARPKPPNKRR